MSSKEQPHQNEKSGLKQQSPQPVVQTQLSPRSLVIQQAKSDPPSSTPANIVQLQRIIGNQAVGQLLARRESSQVIQPKLKTSPYKQAAISSPIVAGETKESLQPRQRQARSEEPHLATKFLPAVGQLEAMPVDNDLQTESPLPAIVDMSNTQKFQQLGLQHVVQLKPEVAYVNRGSKSRAILHTGKDEKLKVKIPNHTQILVDYDKTKQKKNKNYIWAQTKAGEEGIINSRYVLAPMHDFEEKIASIKELEQLFELFQDVGAKSVAESLSGDEEEAKPLFKDLSSCAGTAEMVTRYFVRKGREHLGKEVLDPEAGKIMNIPVHVKTGKPQGDPLDDKHVDEFMDKLQKEPLSIAYITTAGGGGNHYFSIVQSGEKYALYQGWAEKYAISEKINEQRKKEGKKYTAPRTNMNTTNMDSKDLRQLLTKITEEKFGVSPDSEAIFGAKIKTNIYSYHVEGIKEAKKKA